MVNSNQQITEVPAAIWYVHIDNKFDSMWPSRTLARQQKKALRNYGVDSSIQISSSTITLGSIQVDKHS